MPPLLFLRIAALPIALALTACAPDDVGEPPAEEAVTVTAQPVIYRPEQREVEAIGTARAQDSAEIYPETDGRVTAVLFQGGDYVRSGDPLIRLDSREETLAVELAKNAVREAEQLLGRYRRIEDTGALSESQIEQGETALVSAQIQLRQARLALANRTVRAPFSGNIGFTEVDVGDRITTSTLIAQLDRRSVLFVDFQAPESVYDAMTPGRSINITPYSMPGRTFEAEVRDRNTTISSEERTFTVRARVPNTGDALRPGMSFRINLDLAGRELPAVPEEAIIWGSDGAHLFRVVDGTARRLPLTIVARREGLALVDAQLPRGATIIAKGAQKVRDGSKVEIVETQSAPTVRASKEGAAARSGRGRAAP
tara:strand:- start:656 stop:1762 length:1107 start_codon:yes stop_codon:yes gene_type:complete